MALLSLALLSLSLLSLFTLTSYALSGLNRIDFPTSRKVDAVDPFR